MENNDFANRVVALWLKQLHKHRKLPGFSYGWWKRVSVDEIEEMAVWGLGPAKRLKGLSKWRQTPKSIAIFVASYFARVDFAGMWHLFTTTSGTTSATFVARGCQQTFNSVNTSMRNTWTLNSCPVCSYRASSKYKVLNHMKRTYVPIKEHTCQILCGIKSTSKGHIEGSWWCQAFLMLALWLNLFWQCRTDLSCDRSTWREKRVSMHWMCHIFWKIFWLENSREGGAWKEKRASITAANVMPNLARRVIWSCTRKTATRGEKTFIVNIAIGRLVNWANWEGM